MSDIASMSLKSVAAALGGKVLRDAKGPYVLAPGPALAERREPVRQADVVGTGWISDPLLCGRRSAALPGLCA